MIEPSTPRILNAKDRSIGAGFGVSRTLAATCACLYIIPSVENCAFALKKKSAISNREGYLLPGIC